MKTAGIICEYNPFHNGHEYQLQLAKRDYDAVVCIMSGSFVQRGEAAVFDKWTRTEAALLSGADLVLELPVRFCLSSAQGFASGAVEILNSSGVVDALVFGSECADIGMLTYAADIMLSEPPEVSDKIKHLLGRGMGFAAAREAAYSGIIGDNLLSEPNNVLALEYIMALNRLNSSITPVTHFRTVGYHSVSESGSYASATLIRERMKNGVDTGSYLPYNYSGKETYDINRLTDIFRYRLITEGSGLFTDIPDAEKGLENRFTRSVNLSSIDEITGFVCNKRHTRARIRRIILSALLNLRGGYRNPEYIRVLGMSETGKILLAEMRKKSSLPVVNKTADFDSPMLREDITATNLAALCASEKVPMNRDFLKSPIIKNK